MTTIVKAASPADFLSLVPHMLGYRPRNSLVLVPFHGSRSLGAMRFDLPADNADLDCLAATVVGMACRVASIDAAAVVVYVDEPLRATALPRRELFAALDTRADECGIRVKDALCVGEDAWGSYLDDRRPVRRHRLSEIDRDHEGLAPPEGDHTSGVELPAVSDSERLAVAGAIEALDDAVEAACRSAGDSARSPSRGRSRVDPRALASLCAVDDLPKLFEDALSWDAATVDPFDIAAIAWCLARPSLRDIALLQWCRDQAAGDEALDAQLRWSAGDEYPVHIARQMWGEGDPPDDARLLRALELARRVASASPDEFRPGPLATAAWISWALGRSTHADLYARRAGEIEPEHGLAEIVRALTAAGHVPDWAFRVG